jgi:hypothetical protein
MSRITLQDVENIVAQLSSDDQLKLIAHVNEHLKGAIPSEIDEEQWRRENAERIKAFLKMCDEMKVKTIGKTDSAEDIRQIREERMSRL